ncbi:PAPA-1-like conserved region-domain-containing protein [Xylaria intraflava]|nr:PAPA-1-like conserved region-domain-containing protein [Xylaria intraflava]
MSSRPRRAAAQRANKTITDMVDSDNHISSRTGRVMSSRASRRSEGKSAAASITRGPPSSPPSSNHHIHLTVKLPASKLRQATSSRSVQSGRQTTRDSFSGGEIIEGKRNRSKKKSYVVETSDDDDEDDGPAGAEEDGDEDSEVDDDDMMDDDEEDAEGEIVVDDTMDIDAEEDDDEGDEDAEGEDDDMDMSVIPPPAPVIKVSKPPTKATGTSKSRVTMKSASRAAASHVKESDDEELSELESDPDEIQDTVKVGGGDEDAEGEDEGIEEAEPADEDGNLASDDDGSRAETPDLTRMTKRQRARFVEDGDALMKLSDEVQAKKHFTAEELSMRRAEMARRRRNLSEKRNEEVKMETINKLLKKQAPKTNRKAQLGMESTPDIDTQKPSPIFVRWVSNKDGFSVAVPDEMLSGPAGNVFVKR